MVWSDTAAMADGGAGTANWHDAANWSPDGVPAAADDVVIESITIA